MARKTAPLHQFKMLVTIVAGESSYRIGDVVDVREDEEVYSSFLQWKSCGWVDEVTP